MLFSDLKNVKIIYDVTIQCRTVLLVKLAIFVQVCELSDFFEH